MNIASSDLYPLIQDQRDFLSQWRQQQLQDTNAFTWFCKNLSLSVLHGTKGDIAHFWEQGWIRSDEQNVRMVNDKRFTDYSPESPRQNLFEIMDKDDKIRIINFHPFRVLTVQRIMETYDLKIAPTSVTAPGYAEFVLSRQREIRDKYESPSFRQSIDSFNGIADLFILLEPLWWPLITNVSMGRKMITLHQEDQSAKGEFEAYQTSVYELLTSIGFESLSQLHSSLCRGAHLQDPNDELYLLIRSSHWHKRKDIKGKIGLAMWTRHVAELLRLSVKQAFGQELPSEDVSFGQWHEGAREFLYGANNPLETVDSRRVLRQRLVPSWGLSSGPRVRLYVEGETELAFYKHLLGASVGPEIEIINVKGQLNSLWLTEHLENDIESHRFSVIVLDTDSKDFVKAVSQMAAKDLIVGEVRTSSPDFEIANFSPEQLLRALNLYEAESGFTFEDELSWDLFESAQSGKALTRIYSKLRKAPSFKGKNWGIALAQSILEIDSSESTETLDLCSNLLFAGQVDYVAQRFMFRVDPTTFETYRVQESPYPAVTLDEEFS